jgi:hypothetical protein
MLQCAISDVRAIWKTTVCILEDGPFKEINDALIRFRFFRRIVKALTELTKRAPIHDPNNPLRAHSIRMQASDTMGDVAFGLLLATKPARAIAQGIRGGLHNYFLQHFLPHVDTKTSQYRELLDAYKSISLHVIYPAVRDTTTWALKNQTSKDLQKAARDFPDFKDAFNMFDFAKEGPSGARKLVEYMKQLCDNPKVSNITTYFLLS